MTFYLILPHKVILELIRVSTFSDISASPFGVYSPKLHVYITPKELLLSPLLLLMLGGRRREDRRIFYLIHVILNTPFDPCLPSQNIFPSDLDPALILPSYLF